MPTPLDAVKDDALAVLAARLDALEADLRSICEQYTPADPAMLNGSELRPEPRDPLTAEPWMRAVDQAVRGYERKAAGLEPFVNFADLLPRSLRDAT